MGACASSPKTLGDAPVPEQPKEESTNASENVAVTEKPVEEVKAEEEVKTTVADDDEEKEKSLGSLIESTEEVKEADTPAVDEKEASPAVEEEKKTEAEAEEPKKE